MAETPDGGSGSHARGGRVRALSGKSRTRPTMPQQDLCYVVEIVFDFRTSMCHIVYKSDKGGPMTPTMTAEPKTIQAFPAAEIETSIRDFLAKEGEMQADLHGGTSTTGDTGGAIGPQPVIDSLVVVEVLLEVETKVPFALPDDLVQAGGYDSVDKVVEHLMPQLQKRWKKHHEEKK